jgi:hypothetical protein
MPARLTIRSLTNQLLKRIDELEEQYEFDPTDGDEQAELMTDEVTILNYGKYSAIRDIVDQLE